MATLVISNYPSNRTVYMTKGRNRDERHREMARYKKPFRLIPYVRIRAAPEHN
jgi:hypothetical protein